MLNKLLKHEFRATGRILLPTLAGVVLLSAMAGVSYRIMSTQENVFWMLRILLALLQGAFFLSLFAVCVLVVVMIVLRFYRSLMGDEGYLSFTLPVTADGHLWSKLLSSLVWMVALALVCFLALVIFFAVGGIGTFSDFDVFSLISKCFETFGAANTIGFMVEFVAALALTCFTECLHFYAAIAIGCSFSKSKKLLSVVFFFVLSILRNVISLSMVGALATRSVWQWVDMHMSFETFSEAIPALHILWSGSCVATAVLGAVYYFISRYFMTKKLNLA